jgi:hypothetical protein
MEVRMSDDNNNRRDDPFFTTGVIAAMLVAVFLAAGLFVWQPWTGSRGVADNSAPGVTTGQSASVPRAPPAPASPSK